MLIWLKNHGKVRYRTFQLRDGRLELSEADSSVLVLPRVVRLVHGREDQEGLEVELEVDQEEAELVEVDVVVRETTDRRGDVPSSVEGAVYDRLEKPEPDLSAESTPTGGWCQMKQASIFTENLPRCYRNFTSFHSCPQISDNFD